MAGKHVATAEYLRLVLRGRYPMFLEIAQHQPDRLVAVAAICLLGAIAAARWQQEVGQGAHALLWQPDGDRHARAQQGADTMRGIANEILAGLHKYFSHLS